MSRPSNQAPPNIQLEVIPAIGETGVYLTQTVPIGVWNNVGLLQRVSAGLSVFDRFTLESMLQLGTCTVEDLCEVIGIDDGLALWWLEMIEMKGLARKVGEITFVPNIDMCVDALARNSISEQKETEKSIVWFVQTAEMIILSPQDSILKKFSKVNPSARFPLSDEMASTQRGTLVEQSIGGSLVYGNDADSIVGANDSQILNATTCPAYQLEVDLETIGPGYTQVQLYGLPAKKRAQKNEKKQDLIRLSIDLPILSQLIDSSSSMVVALSSHLCNAMQRDGLLEATIQQHRARATLDYDQALLLEKEGLLDCHKRLRFVIDFEMAYEIPLELVAEDDRVHSLLNRDAAVGAFLAENLTDTLLDDISSDYGVPAGEMVQRLWELKQYAAIYYLREQQDFTE